jgi:hypothetical protein
LELGGKRGLFLFDTGANTSGVDTEWLQGAAHRDAGTGAVTGTTGALATRRAVFDRFEIGDATFRDALFHVQSFAHFSHPPEGPQAGLLGTDFIGGLAYTIDYRTRLIEFGGDEPGGVPIEFPLNLPTAEVTLGTIKLPCRIDSGATYLDDRPFLDVNESTVRALGGTLRETGQIYVVGVSGPETLALLEGNLRLTIGTATIDDVVLVVHRTGTLAVETPLALAGAPILTRLGRLRIDPVRKRLWTR